MVLGQQDPESFHGRSLYGTGIYTARPGAPRVETAAASAVFRDGIREASAMAATRRRGTIGRERPGRPVDLGRMYRLA
ncbi:MAG: hypothetical protein A2X23_04375 [Chloroflexi bacterium GWC2_73_18]|nr:MAG: hypothetical protein A2X23_04375 [Chloroflexi bacterium GWC2_73_18]